MRFDNVTVMDGQDLSITYATCGVERTVWYDGLDDFMSALDELSRQWLEWMAPPKQGMN